MIGDRHPVMFSLVVLQVFLSVVRNKIQSLFLLPRRSTRRHLLRHKSVFGCGGWSRKFTTRLLVLQLFEATIRVR